MCKITCIEGFMAKMVKYLLCQPNTSWLIQQFSYHTQNVIPKYLIKIHSEILYPPNLWSFRLIDLCTESVSFHKLHAELELHAVAKVMK